MAEFMADGEDVLEFFAAPFEKIDNPAHRQSIEELTLWIMDEYPQLVPYIGWNQPMFTAHGTFIFAFSFAKNHVSMTPEAVGMKRFAKEIDAGGFSKTEGLFRVKWGEAMPRELIGHMIEFNLDDKKDLTHFWRHTQDWDGD